MMKVIRGYMNSKSSENHGKVYFKLFLGIVINLERYNLLKNYPCPGKFITLILVLGTLIYFYMHYRHIESMQIIVSLLNWNAIFLGFSILYHRL